MIFAIFMIAAAVAATVFMWMFGGGIVAAVVFAGLLVLTYKALTYQSGPTRRAKPDQLNAFQQPLADPRDDAGTRDRAGHRNKAHRKHLRRKMNG